MATVLAASGALRPRTMLLCAWIAPMVSGCVAARDPSSVAPPAPVAIAPATLYRAGERDTKDEGLDDICRIDPSACPKIETKTTARAFSSEMYAVQQIYGGGSSG